MVRAVSKKRAVVIEVASLQRPAVEDKVSPKQDNRLKVSLGELLIAKQLNKKE